MTGETVVYKNEMNLVPLRRFTATEINLFFAMCNKLKEQDTNCLLYTFDAADALLAVDVLCCRISTQK
ncbi:RepB family plasmid replication initiator protein, partial [Staphylococcus aureus]|nr:RepB family plasmid replication initiator protein [Staphylococcus aureus]